MNEGKKMRVLAISFFILFSSYAWAGVNVSSSISREQVKYNHCSAATCTVNINPTQAGSLLVVSTLGGGYGVGEVGVTDSAGNKFSAICDSNAGNYNTGCLYYTSNIPAGVVSVTHRISSQAYNMIMVAEYSGIATLNPMQASSHKGNSGSLYTSGQMATLMEGNLLIGSIHIGGWNAGKALITPDPGWFLVANDAYAVFVKANAMVERVLSSADKAVYQNSGRLDAQNNSAAIIAAFKPAVPASNPNALTISNISKTDIRPSVVTINWTTDNLSTSQIDYGTSDTYGLTSVFDPTLTKSHSQKLFNLDPSTTYHFRVRSKDANNEETVSTNQRFTTQVPQIFYIAANGLDSNDGMSKETPWQHAPGMTGCALACAAKIPQPGDRYILKGGDTWHNSATSNLPAGLPWTFRWSGKEDGLDIYIGVDQAWFNPQTCGTTFCRPILNGDKTVVPGGDVFFSVNALSYITVDNLEFFNIYLQTFTQYGQNIFFLMGSSDHVH